MSNYCKDMIYRWDMIGHEIASGPFANFTSAQRLMMMSKNLTQWCEILGGEFPKIFTGIESVFGDYTFDKSPIEQDVIIIKVVNKYGTFHGDYRVNINPVFTVIYKGVEDKKIGSFDVCNYRYLSRGFGYKTKIINKNLLTKGSRIEKGTCFQESPAKEDNLYKMGCNANVTYMPILPSTNDAFIVSRSLSKKMTTTHMYEIEIPIEEDKLPLALFPSKDGEHKFIPDLGEQVGEDGMLMALRPIKENGLISDYTDEKLKVFNSLTDIPFRVDPGSTIIDIDVYSNPNRWNEIQSENSIFKQLVKYQHNIYNYYNEILEVYAQNPHEKYSSKMINNLAKYALLMPNKSNIAYHNILGGKKIKKDAAILNKGNPIELCVLKITVAIDKPLEVGSKLTGRDGSKGVVAAIWPDEWMPVDAWGFRADIIINSNSIANRMNISQLFEQFFNRLSDLVIIDTMHLDTQAAYKRIIEYLTDFDEDYGKLVLSQTDYQQELAVKEWRQAGINLNVPCTKKHFGKAHTKYMAEKYNYRVSPLTYTYPLADGKTKTVITNKAECIGSKYMFLINKVPYTNAIELGYVSQLMLPVKNKYAKYRSISQTAIRFGEDEFRNWLIGVKASIAARILNVSGNSPNDAKEIFYRGLTDDYPSNLRALPYSNEEIANRSVPLRLVNHILGAAGINITKDAIYRES